jgi:outer membrane protein TolC
MLHFFFYALLFCITTIFFVYKSHSMTLSEALNLTVANSNELKMEEKKSQIVAISKAESLTMFLPHVDSLIRNGSRIMYTDSIRSDLSAKERGLTITQPLFTGFQGLSRAKEAKYKARSASKTLRAHKNDILLELTKTYLNVIKYQKFVTSNTLEAKYYDQILTLAKKNWC